MALNQISILQGAIFIILISNQGAAANQLVINQTITSLPRPSGVAATTASRHQAVGENLGQVSRLDSNDDNLEQFRLPSWLNFTLYKQFFGKRYRSSKQNELHQRIYLRTALKVLEQRVQYRMGRLAALSSVNELSDLTSEELVKLKSRSTLKEGNYPTSSEDSSINKPGPSGNRVGGTAAADKIDCCTYEQLYSRILQLLNRTNQIENSKQLVDDKTTNVDTSDFNLGRALLEELEQEPLVPEASSSEMSDDKHLEMSHDSMDLDNNNDQDDDNLDRNRTESDQVKHNLNRPHAEAPRPATPLERPEGIPRGSAEKLKEIESLVEKLRVLRAKHQGRDLGSDKSRSSLASENSKLNIAQSKLSKSILESVTKQLVQQLGENSSLNNQLKASFSAMYGRPVVVKARILNETMEQV